MVIDIEWQDKVRTALVQTFGVASAEETTVVSGGLSGTAVLRIVVAGTPYLMRLDRPGVGIRPPKYWHPCMAIAAEAGVAPPVLYLDDAGVSIVGFVQAASGGSYWLGNRTEMLYQIGKLLGKLHDAPAFPVRQGYVTAVQALIEGVTSSGLMSASELEVPLERFARLGSVYKSLEEQLVSSHNDVNPRNLVFDGVRYWLVDWAASSVCDRYVDLASVAGFLAQDPESEATLLHAYFGEPATPAQSARMYLARQINHMCCAMTLLPTTDGARPPSVRSLSELHLAIRKGEPIFDTHLGRAEYALARCAAMVAGVDSDRFEISKHLAE
jgi:aminoglycoside phosphotransferase (APT) family kinase protein